MKTNDVFSERGLRDHTAHGLLVTRQPPISISAFLYIGVVRAVSGVAALSGRKMDRSHAGGAPTRMSIASPTQVRKVFRQDGVLNVCIVCVGS